MNDRPRSYVLSLALMAALYGAAALAAEKPLGSQKRARPPKWSADALDAFYPDAREKLVGTRPDYQQTKMVATVNNNSSETPTAATASGDAGWSKLIDAESIETEIKRVGQEVAKDVTTPGAFKGGAYKECRRHFSVLAMLFAVAAEYDGEVRWQDAAAALRDLFSRAGHNCKVGTDQTFQEATQRKQDLADLIAGNRPKTAEAERKADWGQVADRPPLMQRMNVAHQDRLKKWLANKEEFAAHRDDIRHEVQLIAMIADVIGREGFDYWDDEQYAQFARDLRQSATEVSAAVERDNFEQARQAIGGATKACTNCHEAFRG